MAMASVFLTFLDAAAAIVLIDGLLTRSQSYTTGLRDSLAIRRPGPVLRGATLFISGGDCVDLYPSKLDSWNVAAPPHPDADPDALRARLDAAEAHAAELEEWLAVTFDPSPVAMGIISSLENRYVRANAALADLYDMPVEEILNTDPFALGLDPART